VGAWGYQIFEDDVALDVRGDFEEAIASGASPERATRLILQKYGEQLDDEDDRPVIYLALASLELERGRVTDPIRTEALKIIDRGEGLARWEEAGEEALVERKKVLQALRTSILAPS